MIETARAAKKISIRKIRRNIILIIFVITLIIVDKYILPQSRIIEGSSMEPFLHSGDKIFVVDYNVAKHLQLYTEYTKLTYWDKVVVDTHQYARFSTDITESARQPYSIKSILGRPGDLISFEPTGVYVNGELVDYPSMGGDAISEIELEEDYYFIVGINAVNSYDSRYYGPIHISQIKFVYIDKHNSSGLGTSVEAVKRFLKQYIR